MSDRAPYSRVYWSVMDDAKFDGIREDCRHMGAWTMLLIVADMAWPSPAFPPPTVSKASMRALVEAGIVDPLTGGRFRIHGLDSERERRREIARSGIKRDPLATRTGPERDPNGPQAKPSLAEPSTSQAEAPRDPADIYWQLTGKFPVDGPLSWIDEMTGKYGSEPTITALATAFGADRSTKTLLGRTQDILRAGARELDRKEKADEQARLREKRSKPRVMEAWQEEFRAQVQAQYDREAS